MDIHSSGVGGGHLMTIYNKKEKKCLIIDAREQAPAAATETMFGKDTMASVIGWRAVAVPGEVHGLYTAYKLGSSGKVPWRDLVTPSADLCHYGLPVSGALAKAIVVWKDFIMKEEPLKELLTNKKTGQLYKESEILIRPALAATLYDLANAKDPIEWFYNSNVTKAMAAEFQQNGGIITEKDFNDYKAKTGKDRPVITTKLGPKLVACGPPPPSSASVTMSILNILQGYDISESKLQNFDFQALTYHRLIEAMKFAYASRLNLGDMDFVENALHIANNITSPEFGDRIRKLITDKANPDINYYMREGAAASKAEPPKHGTTHISVLDEEGNAAAITTTINVYFGGNVMSKSTGIIWNDEMDDFSNPSGANFFGFAPSPSNFIRPGKKPMSSMSPIVIYDSETGDVKIVGGSEGGSHIISAVASLFMRILWFGQDPNEAISAPRLHNQLTPFYTEFEEGFPEAYLQNLRERGQNMSTYTGFELASTAISHGDDGRVYANSDYRKTGSYAAGY